MSVSGPAEELALLESLHAQDPGGRIFLRLGRAYLEAGRPSQAVQVLEQGMALHPAELTGRHLLAQARLALGQRDEALAELQRADRALSELAGVYAMLAELLPQCGRSAEGLRAAILARELKALPNQDEAPGLAEPAEPPPLPTETATLAQIYAAQGLTEQARAIYRRLGRAPEADTLAEAEDQSAPPETPPTATARPTASRPGPAKALRRLEALRSAAMARVG